MENKQLQRQPIVAIVGHIDHGKSTLLDYIRKTNIVESEAGGITQHLSAYEIDHTTKEGAQKKITFLDTPGHAAFEKMRARGLEVADVAILVVSSEEGVKPQTVEAVKLIVQEKLPYIVAITKIDKAGSNIEKTKSSLIENEIYIEGMGGDIPFVPVSGRRGDGIDELLDLICLSADIKGLPTDPSAAGTGTIIEANVDKRKGISATLIVKDGTLVSGTHIVVGDATAPVRIMQDFQGRPIKEAHAGQPVSIIGFSSLPQIGGTFVTVKNKREAEEQAEEARRSAPKKQLANVSTEESTESPRTILPIVIKADVMGTIDAINHELKMIPQERIELRLVGSGVGGVTESDVKLVAGGKVPGIILGFNAKTDASAKDLAERQGVTIETFDIIYKLAEWLKDEAVKRTPKQLTEEIIGQAKILKLFNSGKGGQVIGGRVEEGEITEGAQVKIMRRDIEIGRGKVGGLQAAKAPVKRVEKGMEFGMLLESKDSPAAGDQLIAFSMTEK